MWLGENEILLLKLLRKQRVLLLALLLNCFEFKELYCAVLLTNGVLTPW